MHWPLLVSTVFVCIGWTARPAKSVTAMPLNAASEPLNIVSWVPCSALCELLTHDHMVAILCCMWSWGLCQAEMGACPLHQMTVLSWGCLLQLQDGFFEK